MSDDAVFRAIGPVSVWEAFIDRLNALVEECVLEVGDEGIDATAVDPANVGMIDTTVGPAAFDSYDAADFRIGIDLDRLNNAIGLADDSDDVVEFTFDTQTHTFDVVGPDFDFTIQAIDPDSVRGEPDIPDLDLPIDLEVEGEKLQRAVDGGDMVSDHVVVEYDGTGDTDVLRLSAEGDVDDVTFEWDADELEAVHERTSESVTSMYSLDYLDDIVGALDGDEPVRMILGGEFPTKLRQSYADDEAEGLYMLAPRIQSD